MEKIGANANIRLIGVTGNVSSGKSTVLATLTNNHISTISVDAVIHNLYQSNEELIDKITALLGKEVRNTNTLNTKLVAKKIFNNTSLLHQLETLTTPYVLNEIDRAKKNANKVLVVEFPLIFELSLEKIFDSILFIDTDKEICEQRSTLKDIKLRNSRFLPREVKIKKATKTISNNGTLAEFKQNIQAWMEGIMP